MKKIIALVLALALCLSAAASLADGIALENLKIGMITLHDEQSTYDKNFIDAFKQAALNKGLTEDQFTIVSGIPESDECRDQAETFADEGYNLVFADSFGHEDYMIEAAKKYPEVQFCHATGTKAHTEGLSNFHNAFASIYEGRYLAGIVAGMKLKEMKEAGKLNGEVPVIGYIGAFPYAEVKSGYTSFYLGAKTIVEDVQMKVIFTSSWYDEIGERNAALALIDAKCDLISQHADSMGAPTACQEKGVPNVSYNGSTVDACPDTFLVASKINWVPYFEYLIDQLVAGEAIATDWTGTIATGSVELTELNEKTVAEGTEAAIVAASLVLASGLDHVFNTELFTVNGEHLTSYTADVDTDAAFTPDTEVISDGYFHESELRSAPYFDIDIDGIEILNN